MTDAHAKAVEAAAGAIYEVLEGPIADQDFRRQQRQAALATRLSVAAITAYLAAMRAEGWVMVRKFELRRAADCIEMSDQFRGGNPAFEQARAAMLKGATDVQG